jgi:hypothetical protein
MCSVRTQGSVAQYRIKISLLPVRCDRRDIIYHFHEILINHFVSTTKLVIISVWFLVAASKSITRVQLLLAEGLERSRSFRLADCLLRKLDSRVICSEVRGAVGSLFRVAISNSRPTIGLVARH